MKIAIVYTGITSYMTDCWRELAQRHGIELRIWIEDTKTYRFKGDRTNALRGLSCHWDYSENLTAIELRQAEHEILAFAPDVIFVCGWSRELPPYIASSKRLAHIPMVLEMDMPWEWRLRKIAARFVLRWRLQRFSAVFVPGKSSAMYAHWLGFSTERIYEGRYCVNVDRFRCEAGLRSGFLFIGRHVFDKGLDVLDKGFAEYKRMGGKWSVTIPDFVEPDNVPEIMRKNACLIVPSRWEPWGVVVLEAMAAGMKVVVSSKVGARYDLPVDAVFASGNSKQLSRVMLGIEKGANATGENDRDELLKKYDVKAWTDRVIEICSDVARS